MPSAMAIPKQAVLAAFRGQVRHPAEQPIALDPAINDNVRGRAEPVAAPPLRNGAASGPARPTLPGIEPVSEGEENYRMSSINLNEQSVDAMLRAAMEHGREIKYENL
jgi:hypothetical protein